MNFLLSMSEKKNNLSSNLLPIVSNPEREQVPFQPLKRFLLVSQQCFRIAAYCPIRGQSCTRLRDDSGPSTNAGRF